MTTPAWEIRVGDCRDTLRAMPDGAVQTVVTSPPYFALRDYGHEDQIGLERDPEGFVAALVDVFREVRRVLRDDGTLWLNLGDTYNAYNGNRGGGRQLNGLADEQRNRVSGGAGLTVPTLKPKDLIGIPWMVAFALRADGWTLRSEIIWHKPNPMPESVSDRPTKAHEQIFLLSKGPRYFYDADAIREPHLSAADPRARPDYEVKRGRAVPMPDGDEQRIGTVGPSTWPAAGRNKRTVWTVATQPYDGAHFATFPPSLIEPCVLAGSLACGNTEDPSRCTVLDPFAGAGTTGLVAVRNGRTFVGCELNDDYAAIARERISTDIRLGHRSPQRGPDLSDEHMKLFLP